MRIRTTELTTRLRTWMLVAGLTALMVTIGALLGGAFLWLFAGLAVAFNVVGYLYSDRIALRLAEARPLPENAAAEVRADVRRLAGRAGIPMPRLYLMPGEQPNAFATGRDPGHAAIALTEGMLAELHRDQVRGVMAHEISHIANRDVLVSSIAATIAGVVSAVANVIQLSFLFGGDEQDNPLGLLGALAASVLAPLGAMLMQLAVSRQREYLADATAAKLLGEAAPLADALESIERTQSPPLTVNPATAPMYIVNPLASGQVATLFSTHPPLAERIRRLRALDAEALGSLRPSGSRAAVAGATSVTPMRP